MDANDASMGGLLISVLLASFVCSISTDPSSSGGGGYLLIKLLSQKAPSNGDEEPLRQNRMTAFRKSMEDTFSTSSSSEGKGSAESRSNVLGNIRWEPSRNEIGEIGKETSSIENSFEANIYSHPTRWEPGRNAIRRRSEEDYKSLGKSYRRGEEYDDEKNGLDEPSGRVWGPDNGKGSCEKCKNPLGKSRHD